MELRADFQQYFHLNIDDMGKTYSIYHAVCLACSLPSDARTVNAFNSHGSFTKTDALLARIDYLLQCILKAQGAKTKPQMVDFSIKSNTPDAQSIDKLKQLLKLKREEVSPDGGR